MTSSPARTTAWMALKMASVAALVTKQELDGEIGDATVGAQARQGRGVLEKGEHVGDRVRVLLGRGGVVVRVVRRPVPVQREDRGRSQRD